ncbi:glycosyltransferase family 8 protein [[Candida] arabinofermentans NRRL YB-2248]|uniref:Glycosyltransferase family 8 protein n=1 Tax=[Candida] arabinofermentans NRRL YB-2248 TaxID=983967 RepID=A0A1E4T0L2_9ASCO|nr:glycosyltransferase family 8 protein [[Candida] arabinofermentans NRRL YB-2248]
MTLADESEIYPKDTDLSSYKKIWTSLITNKKYVTGLLTLNYCLKIKCKSKYPLVAIYTTQLDLESVKLIQSNNIPIIQIDQLQPSNNHSREYSNDPRFYDTWSKLQPFKMIQFERIIQLDSDMAVIKNMDELMTFEMPKDTVFAASPACVCNPLKIDHYPSNWIPKNCSFTNYAENIKKTVHDLSINDFKNPDHHHILGPHANSGLKLCNGGLIVVIPNLESYQLILDTLQDPSKTDTYDFPDQALLADVFKNKWVSLSYKYNCLKTLKNCHFDIWNHDEIKNIHYIITPKPWDVKRGEFDDVTGTFEIWWDINDERLQWFENGMQS